MKPPTILLALNFLLFTNLVNCQSALPLNGNQVGFSNPVTVTDLDSTKRTVFIYGANHYNISELNSFGVSAFTLISENSQAGFSYQLLDGERSSSQDFGLIIRQKLSDKIRLGISVHRSILSFAKSEIETWKSPLSVSGNVRYFFKPNVRLDFSLQARRTNSLQLFPFFAFQYKPNDNFLIGASLRANGRFKLVHSFWTRYGLTNRIGLVLELGNNPYFLGVSMVYKLKSMKLLLSTSNVRNLGMKAGIGVVKGWK